jgi:hypothetical protein
MRRRLPVAWSLAEADRREANPRADRPRLTGTNAIREPNFMTTTSPIDLLGLKVFTQMLAEESQEDRDLVAAKIFGDLHSLVCKAESRAALRLDALERFVSTEEVEKTKADLDDGATGEILLIATILRVMAETTTAHADDLRADEATLRAEDTESRAGRYRAAYDSILHVFNE